MTVRHLMFLDIKNNTISARQHIILVESNGELRSITPDRCKRVGRFSFQPQLNDHRGVKLDVGIDGRSMPF